MSAKPTTAKGPEPTHEQITERARQIWTERGQPADRDLEHWLEAERQLRGGSSIPAKPANRGKDLDEAERRLDGLVERPRTSARRTPSGEQL